jgi:hypothetical protein
MATKKIPLLWSQQVAAAFLVRAWNAVSTAVLDEAWALYEELEENEE